MVWGVTNKGNRAEFDFPTSDDGYVNHHVTCVDRGSPFSTPSHAENEEPPAKNAAGEAK